MTENTTLRRQARQLITGNQRLEQQLAAARDNNRFLDARIARLEPRSSR